MNKTISARRALQEILEYEEMFLFHPVEHYTDKLSKRCPDGGSEIRWLLTAFESEVVAELQRLGQRQIPSILLPKMIHWLQRESALTAQEASWSVHSWAMAMGLIPFSEESELFSSLPT